MRRFVIL